MVKQQMSVLKLSFFMENHFWSWQGKLIYPITWPIEPRYIHLKFNQSVIHTVLLIVTVHMCSSSSMCEALSMPCYFHKCVCVCIFILKICSDLPTSLKTTRINTLLLKMYQNLIAFS